MGKHNIYLIICIRLTSAAAGRDGINFEGASFYSELPILARYFFQLSDHLCMNICFYKKSKLEFIIQNLYWKLEHSVL